MAATTDSTNWANDCLESVFIVMTDGWSVVVVIPIVGGAIWTFFPDACCFFVVFELLLFGM